MRKFAFLAFLLISILACNRKATLSDQLRGIFSDHLARLDTAARVNSVGINWNVAVTQRLTRIIDDSIYVREYSRIKAQLANTQDKDSIEIYQYEIGYMEKEIDSISNSVGHGDTTHLFGHLLNCSYLLNKNGKIRADSTLLFMDSTGVVRYTEYMDSALAGTIRSLK